MNLVFAEYFQYLALYDFPVVDVMIMCRGFVVVAVRGVCSFAEVVMEIHALKIACMWSYCNGFTCFLLINWVIIFYLIYL